MEKATIEATKAAQQAPTAPASPTSALAIQAQSPAVALNQKSLFKNLAQQWDLQIMIIPAVVFILIFQYVPMWGILMAFQDFNLMKGFMGSEWVGFKHFELFFAAPEFWSIMRNTIVISVLKLIFSFTAPIFLALILNEVRGVFFKRTIQTISYLPYFISWVIVSGLVFSFLSVDNGSVNILLMWLGIIDEPINWMSVPGYFWAVIVMTDIWKNIGFGAIIYLASIAGVDPSLYEAAEMDGAGRIRKIASITLPCIAPIITILLVLEISKILNAGFEEILLMTNRGTNAILRPVSEIIDTYVYRIGIENARYSYATAVGVFKSVLSVILLVTANSVARKLGKSSLW